MNTRVAPATWIADSETTEFESELEFVQEREANLKRGATVGLPTQKTEMLLQVSCAASRIANDMYSATAYERGAATTLRPRRKSLSFMLVRIAD